MPWAVEEVSAMCPVNGAVRVAVTVVPRKLMMSTHDYRVT